MFDNLPVYVREMRERFGIRLREKRERNGQEAADVARQLEVSQATISQWETGRKFPSIQRLYKIHQVYKVSIDYLFGIRNADAEIEHPVRIFRDQWEANKEIIPFIERQVDAPNVYLIQYSSDLVFNIVQAARQKRCKIFLLVKHPGEANEPARPGADVVSKFQRDNKIIPKLQLLLDQHHMRNDKNIQIKCYWFPGAMRGVYVGSPLKEGLRAVNGDQNEWHTRVGTGLLSFSYYRYTEGFTGVVGAENPHFHLYTNIEQNEWFYDLFENTFVQLWNNSVRAADVIPENKS